MAKAACDAVRSKELEIIPSQFEAGDVGMLEDIRDWCDQASLHHLHVSIAALDLVSQRCFLILLQVHLTSTMVGASHTILLHQVCAD